LEETEDNWKYIHIYKKMLIDVNRC
jgi:hypothetical protein